MQGTELNDNEGMSLRSGRVVANDVRGQEAQNVPIDQPVMSDVDRGMQLQLDVFRQAIMEEVTSMLRNFFHDIRDEFRGHVPGEEGGNQHEDAPQEDIQERPQTVPGQAVTRGFFRPEKFDGSQPWEEYQCHFETVARSNGWDKGMMGSALASSLTGLALPILTELAGSQDYGKLISALNSQFGESNRAQLYMDRLRARSQLQGEDISVFAREVRVLARKALSGIPGDSIELLVVSQFVEGLRDGRVRELVMLGAPKDLQSALSLALRSEAAVLRARRSTGAPPVRVIQRVEEEEQVRAVQKEVYRQSVRPGLRPAGKLICWRCDTVGHGFRDCPTRVVICWRCDATGHNVRECPTKQGNGPRS
ncbi:hypothetical protein GE061_016886 [Apolygus lucorum]|uniref:CCHC-type domain-containing protein n=1 Tax=Apolygus lucorum TaxID=248454 RepID=A0A8S9XHA5_APOLU|nr:hypothetical protein GE061_016886 [Apolygus lucorum]